MNEVKVIWSFLCKYINVFTTDIYRKKHCDIWLCAVIVVNLNQSGIYKCTCIIYVCDWTCLFVSLWNGCGVCTRKAFELWPVICCHCCLVKLVVLKYCVIYCLCGFVTTFPCFRGTAWFLSFVCLSILGIVSMERLPSHSGTRSKSSEDVKLSDFM